jgi:aminobenzoyl-glutamate transport protein
MARASKAEKTLPERLLDLVEVAGNRVPHPAIIFLVLIGVVVLLSHFLYLLGSSVSYQVVNPETHEITQATTSANSLLTGVGIRFMFTSVVQNFMNFNAVGVIIVAMVGVGVAEEAGLVKALIRKLVIVSPPGPSPTSWFSWGSCRVSPRMPAISS